MIWMTSLTLAGVAATWACPAQTRGAEPAADAPGTATPAAAITLDDGSILQATLLGAEGGVLKVVEDGREQAIPLRRVDRLVFGPRQHSGAAESPDLSDGVVLEQLLKIVARNEPYGARRYRPLSAFHVDGMMRGGYRLYGGEYRQMLSPRLLPALLDAAGDPRRRWLLIGPLAAMYRIGRARELPRLPGNENAPVAQRVVAAAALYRAGEPVGVDQLCVMFRAASELDLQKALVWLLGQSKDPGAVETVLNCLHHPDEQMREVAVRAAGSQEAPEAAEPLAEIIRQRWKVGKDATFPIGAMGRIKTRESARLLIDLIGEVQETDPESHTLGQLVWAFGSVTGQSFSGKTHADSARIALQWWYEEP